jgi:cytochrome c553
MNYSLNYRAIFGILSLSLLSAEAHADSDLKVGAQKIRTFQCVSCHGKDGLSKLPGAPNLAGQDRDYMVSAINAYRSGDRKNETMGTVVQSLKDADIADVTAYYSSIQITAKVQGP